MKQTTDNVQVQYERVQGDKKRWRGGNKLPWVRVKESGRGFATKRFVYKLLDETRLKWTRAHCLVQALNADGWESVEVKHLLIIRSMLLITAKPSSFYQPNVKIYLHIQSPCQAHKTPWAPYYDIAAPHSKRWTISYLAGPSFPSFCCPIFAFLVGLLRNCYSKPQLASLFKKDD